MKCLTTLAGLVMIGFTLAPLCATAVAEERVAQTADHAKPQQDVPPTPIALPSAPPLQREVKPGPADRAIVTPTLLYKPPLGLGAPSGLVAGASRGTSVCGTGRPEDHNAEFLLSVLAPTDHAGLTIHEQPSLYWYLSAATNCRIEVTLTNDRSIAPLLELSSPPPIRQGVQRVQLADHGVRLAPGVQYQWTVALVPDPEHRSKDIIAEGWITRIAPTEMLQTQIAQAQKVEVAALYAEAGMWYDAMAAISELIAAAPQDPALRRQRTALLEQVRLPDVAEYDQKISTDSGS